MENAKQGKPAEQSTGGYKDRPWIPRFWDGMTLSGWIGLLIRNHFAIAPHRIGMAIIVLLVGIINFYLWVIQTLIFGRRIERTRLKSDPIFVIGHWRSGTTLLHELLVLDPRHTYPDTYACFAPNHFLISAWLFKPLLKILLPSRRPMDNMAAGWNRPQEDEFAMCNMGVRSPYLTIAFPNRPPQDQEYLDLEGLPLEAVDRWKSKLFWFLQCLTLRTPKRIVLKSPPHTCRIKVLLELFPNAKFIHIVRNPHVLFPSTVNLWKRLYIDEGLQTPACKGLEEYVFSTFEKMYKAFEQDRHLLRHDQFCEARYEDLVANPLHEMDRIYEELELGDFEVTRPAIEAYMANQKDYKTNRYQLSPENRAEIDRRWEKYLNQYGYQVLESEPAKVS
jgi:omega-hydroxy-beta-dihydromenaquinone-9 sulfotransferase